MEECKPLPPVPHAQVRAAPAGPTESAETAASDPHSHGLSSTLQYRTVAFAISTGVVPSGSLTSVSVCAPDETFPHVLCASPAVFNPNLPSGAYTRPLFRST